MGKDRKMFSQKLRKEATKEERKLWYDFLRTHPLQFRRQVPFGPYFVDFYCAAARLAIELDGSQHFQDNGPNHDAARSEYLEKTYDLKIMRFANSDMQNFEGVCTAINMELYRRNPSPAPSGGTLPPWGGGQEEPMKTVTIYTDGGYCCADPRDVPIRSRLRRNRSGMTTGAVGEEAL